LWVANLYVEEHYRGIGIGVALFRHMARIAVEDRIEMLFGPGGKLVTYVVPADQHTVVMAWTDPARRGNLLPLAGQQGLKLGAGGLCKVKGEYRIIVDKRASAEERVTTVATALAQVIKATKLDTAALELSPKLREVLRMHEPSPGRPAGIPAGGRTAA
jgi:hypothetical protein